MKVFVGKGGRMKGMSKIAVPVGVVAIDLMLVVPLPAAILDLLLGLNITCSLLILLVAMQIKKPLDFAVFPSLILIATLFRLSLNVSSTRLVLTDGYAGKVIEAFGHFVIGGSLVVGLVIFVILTIIQFVVITNGAGRVAEVGARFTLDAMPGKQMAIDADLNAGLIDEKTARRRRTEVTAEADFYGSMDGASKFVKGDAIAAVIITLINLIGGFAIGVLQRGLAPADAVSTYSLLSVGDGLVSQIPALLISTATGIIVTRSASEADMGSDLLSQLGRYKQPLRRRPARPGQGPAPEGRHGQRPGDPARAHPGQPRPAVVAVRHLAERRPRGQGHLAVGHRAGDRRQPRRAARQGHPRAGLRA